MTLGIRKLIVASLVLLVVLIANIMLIAGWLESAGVIDAARHVRQQFLTGTAITILIALLILLVPAGVAGATSSGIRCDVCGHRGASGRYCSACGSRR